MGKEKKPKPLVNPKKGKVESRIARKNQGKNLAYPIPKTDKQKRDTPKPTDRSSS